MEKPEENDLTAWIAALAHAHTGSKALCRGSYRNVLVQPKQLIFERYADGERVLVAINADGNPFDAHFDAGCGRAVDLITGADHDLAAAARWSRTAVTSGNVSGKLGNIAKPPVRYGTGGFLFAW